VKDLPHTDDLLNVARHVIWFEPPERALAHPVRFLTYLMTYGTKEEVNVVMRYLTVDDFREGLENALPGILMRNLGSTGTHSLAACRFHRCRDA
jgi:hypothetical protein